MHFCQKSKSVFSRFPHIFKVLKNAKNQKKRKKEKKQKKFNWNLFCYILALNLAQYQCQPSFALAIAQPK